MGNELDGIITAWFMPVTAFSAEALSVKVTKPNPRLRPVSRS
jgi:hypothetical protein